MRSRIGIASSWSICGWLSRLLLVATITLLLSLGSVSAQTDTPTPPPFITGVPPTGTPQAGGGSGQMSEIGFNFQSGDGGFFALFGSWLAGLGYQSDLGLLAVYGGFPMTSIAEVTITYDNLNVGDLELRLCKPGNSLCGTQVFSQTVSVPVCGVDACQYTFYPPFMDADRIQVSWESDTAPDGYFLLRGLTVSFSGEVGTYPVDDNGCPVVSPEDWGKLDSFYRAMCSRCFSTPMPPLEQNVTPNPLTPVATLNPTVQGTYSIPILITAGGGTASFITATSWANPTLTRTPTLTPTSNWPPTWTPNPSVSSQNFFVQPPDPALDPFDDQGQYDSQTRRIGPGGVRVNLGNWRWVTQINVTFKAPVATWNSFQIHAQGVYSAPVVVNKNSPANLRTQGIGFAAPVSTNYVDLLPVDDGGGVLRTQYIAVYYSAASTPVPESTPTLTPQASVQWIQPPVTSPYNCEVPAFRDDTPVASFPTNFELVSYRCYTAVPEIEILVLEPDFIIDGLNICVTYFQFPDLDILGIKLSFDWLLIIVIAYLIRMLLKF